MSVLQANTKLVQKGEHWTWNQRSSCSILTGVTLFYCFHVVKPLMPLLALLPMLCVYKNYSYFVNTGCFDSSFSVPIPQTFDENKFLSSNWKIHVNAIPCKTILFSKLKGIDKILMRTIHLDKLINPSVQNTKLIFESNCESSSSTWCAIGPRFTHGDISMTHIKVKYNGKWNSIQSDVVPMKQTNCSSFCWTAFW